MHLGILSSGAGWHVQDLLRASSALGVTAECVDYRAISCFVASGGCQPPVSSCSSESRNRGLTSPARLDDFDALILRTMPAGSLEQIIFRMDAIHAEARAGKRIINPPRAMETCIDKYLCTMRLAHAGLPVPRTVVSQDCDSAMSAFEALGRDVVVKPIFGSEGRGMVRITDAELAWRTFKALEHTGSVIYLQEYIRHPGWDVRAFVIGNRVVACMKRTSHGDWRTNVAQGGTTERYSLSQEETDLALNAARATGAIVAGVDLIQNHRGEWLILEVNAAPGWKALAQTCDIDIARLIVRHLQEWPT